MNKTKRCMRAGRKLNKQIQKYRWSFDQREPFHLRNVWKIPTCDCWRFSSAISKAARVELMNNGKKIYADHNYGFLNYINENPSKTMLLPRS